MDPESTLPTQGEGARPDEDLCDRAHYAAFSHTWLALARASGLDSNVVERRLVRYFRDLCRWLSPAVVVEVGAHEAGFSRWAAAELAGARVLALEANPHVHAKFAGELAGTGVDYRNLAVAPVTGEVTLHLPLEVGGRSRKLTSHMASLAVHTRASEQVQVSVPGSRLDDLVSLGEGERAVAWVDVEGANDQVLRSGPELLDRTDAVYIEVEGTTTWEGQWLDTDVARHLRRHGLVPVARDTKRRHQYNVVYVRAGLVLDRAVTRRAARVLRPRDGVDD